MTKPEFGTILDFFSPNLDKNEFFWDKGCRSLNIRIINHQPKKQKKLMSHR